MCTQKISAIQNQHTFSGTYLICLTEIRHLLMEYSSSNYFFFFQNVLISLIILSTFKVAFVPVLVYFSRGPLYNSWSCGFFFFLWLMLLRDKTTHAGFTCCLIGFSTSLDSLSLTGYENSASWPQRDKLNNFLNCSERSEFL